MNETGRGFGMTGSHFTNATGWPDPDQRVTARDLATPAKRTILDHPEHYHYYGEKAFTWSDILQGNRHPLLYRHLGPHGLKTGHTEEARSPLPASAVPYGRPPHHLGTRT